jgi:hypothetical protein
MHQAMLFRCPHLMVTMMMVSGAGGVRAQFRCDSDEWGQHDTGDHSMAPALSKALAPSHFFCP